jgi:hypothetical protein
VVLVAGPELRINAAWATCPRSGDICGKSGLNPLNAASGTDMIVPLAPAPIQTVTDGEQ